MWLQWSADELGERRTLRAEDGALLAGLPTPASPARPRGSSIGVSTAVFPTARGVASPNVLKDLAGG